MRGRVHARFACFGLALGFALSRLGFADPSELRRMFLLQDARLLLAFGGAVAAAALGFALLRRRLSLRANALHRGTIPGAVAFGAGWALCGACPAAALVQLGEGRLAGAVVVAAVLAGTWLGKRARASLKLDSGSCG